jgi:alpha-1,6-mannosyltransferase
MRVVDTVRELVRRGRRVRAVIAGDGPLRGKLERAASGLPITFLGFVTDRAELARLLATADVVVAPGPIETFGLAALEALASGTPVVVDSGSALPEVVGSAGFAVPGEAESFAGAVEALLEVSRERARNAARDRAECFPWTATAEGFLAAHGLSAAPASVGARS